MTPALTIYDYAVIGFYFAFMALMGVVFKRFIKDTSDYFRAGGEVLWWIVGAGAFMTSFSAVTFTGMAGKYVKLEETIRSFREVAEGKWDHLPEQAFYMVGTIEEAAEKAKRISGEE